jgi:hypothetical protein
MITGAGRILKTNKSGTSGIENSKDDFQKNADEVLTKICSMV